MPPKAKSKPTPAELKSEFTRSEQIASQVEKNVLASYIGTVKMYRRQVTVDWDGHIKNRALDQGATDKLVVEFKTRGLHKDLRENHMNGSLPQAAIPDFVKSLGLANLAELRSKSESGDYILVTKDVWNKLAKAQPNVRVMLHAGQHRFAALDAYKLSTDEKWWPIRIHTHDSLIPTAFGYLQKNTTTTQTTLSDGQRFLVLHQLELQCQEVAAQLQDEDFQELRETLEQLRDAQDMEIARYEEGSLQRHKQICQREDLRDIIAQILTQIPEMANFFKLSPFTSILACRYNRVYIPFGTRLTDLVCVGNLSTYSPRLDARLSGKSSERVYSLPSQ